MFFPMCLGPYTVYGNGGKKFFVSKIYDLSSKSCVFGIRSQVYLDREFTLGTINTNCPLLLLFWNNSFVSYLFPLHFFLLLLH